MSHIKIKKEHVRDTKGRAAMSTQKDTNIWNRQIGWGRRLGLKEKKLLYDLLSTLLDAGISIMDALEVVGDRQNKKHLNLLVQTISQSLANGASFSQAIAEHHKDFSEFEINSILMGEESGSLQKVFSELARHFDSRVQLRQRMIQVASYPMIVLVIAIGVVYFMISKVVPMFEHVFDQFDAELPLITQKILDLSHFLGEKGSVFMLVIGLLGLGVYRIRKKEWMRRFTAKLVLGLPVIGKIVMKVHLARLCLGLGTMLSSGVRLDRALELAAGVSTFYPLQRLLSEIKNTVIAGGSIYHAVEHVSLLPLVFKQMVKVGEKTATLDRSLTKLGHSLEKESGLEISNLTSILEPVLVIILGLVIGVILVAMYLPMFKLGQAISI